MNDWRQSKAASGPAENNGDSRDLPSLTFGSLKFIYFVAFSEYRTRAIITRGLYFFTPMFTAVYIWERFILQRGQYLHDSFFI